MKKAKIEEFEKLVENKTFTTELLIACVRKNELYISKYAYLKKKFQYAGESCNGGNIHEFNKHMEIRNKISKMIKHQFTANEVKALAKEKTTTVSVGILNAVTVLIERNDYTLLD